MKYESGRKELGRLICGTDKGNKIYWYKHLYIRKKNGMWKQLC